MVSMNPYATGYAVLHTSTPIKQPYNSAMQCTTEQATEHRRSHYLHAPVQMPTKSQQSHSVQESRTPSMIKCPMSAHIPAGTSKSGAGYGRAALHVLRSSRPCLVRKGMLSSVTSIDLNSAVKLPLPKPPKPPACSMRGCPSAPTTCTHDHITACKGLHQNPTGWFCIHMKHGQMAELHAYLALAADALDDLNEHGWSVRQRLAENLQQDALYRTREQVTHTRQGCSAQCMWPLGPPICLHAITCNAGL
jgi:hypothetical protein